MGIVVIGAVFVDIKGYPLSTYIPGGRNAGRIEQVHGGVSRNVAEDIANVELRPTFVGLVDDTGMGQDVIDKLDNHKVNTRYIQKVPDGMGTWPKRILPSRPTPTKRLVRPSSPAWASSIWRLSLTWSI